MPPVVSARDLAKVYRFYPRPWDRLREQVTGRPRHRPFPALSGVSFDLARGEGLGIIGENGAGKSTLLKILAGIVEPTSGEISVNGKVASILELASGFHPELSGRQNIVLNAAMLGLSRAEVRERLPAIVAFSELGAFLDQPVKCYSTGMAMRLGFSIATQVDPDVLIIDEALSVGDGYFQKKCMDRILALIAQGKTLLFCSHAMYYVTAFCRRALWLKGGRMEALGPVDEVVREYENYLLAKSKRGVEEVGSEVTVGLGPARLTAVRMYGRNGQRREATPLFRYREPLSLEIDWETEDPRCQCHVGVGIDRFDGVQVCAFATHRSGLPPFSGQRQYRLRLEVPELPLLKGEFSLYVFLLDEQGLHVFDRRIEASAFCVESEGYRFGLIEVPHAWELEEAVELRLAQPA